MCGIVGGVKNKDITALLLEGINRLEYNGYDSSGQLKSLRKLKEEEPPSSLCIISNIITG